MPLASYSGQGTNAPVTALTAEPREEGQASSVENCKFEGELIQDLPEWAVLEKLEEDPITLAWIDELVDHNAEGHDQIEAAYLRGTVAGGTFGNANVSMNAVLCFIKNCLINDPQQHTLTVLSALLGIDFEDGNEVTVVMLKDIGERLHRQGYVWTTAEAGGGTLTRIMCLGSGKWHSIYGCSGRSSMGRKSESSRCG